MTIALATSFPFNAASQVPVLAPNELDPSSRVGDISDPDLGRKLITAKRNAATSYVVTLTVASDQRVNFVSVIGSNQAGAATVELLDSSDVVQNGADDRALALSSMGNGSTKLFGRAFTNIRKVRVTFPERAAGLSLECAAIIVGELKSPQSQPQSVRTLWGRLRFERRPRGVQLPSDGRGLVRTVNLNWVNLRRVERDELRDFFHDTNLHSSIVFYDDASSDGVCYGFIDGTLQITDRQQSDYSEARLRIQELFPRV